MNAELAKLYAGIAEGCYAAASKYREEYRLTGLRNADQMAYRLDQDGDRNWMRANNIDPLAYPVSA